MTDSAEGRVPLKGLVAGGHGQVVAVDVRITAVHTRPALGAAPDTIRTGMTTDVLIFLGGWLIGAWLPRMAIAALDVLCEAYDRSPRGQRETRALDDALRPLYLGPYR